MMVRKNQVILIVEDSPVDYETTIRALKKAGGSNNIQHCEDGDQALDYLFHRGSYNDRNKYPLPGLILLDLNLPGTDGREVLAELKGCDELKKIPVIVLTTSSDEKDIEQCYEYGANSYIQKPVDIEGFFTAIERLTNYWLEIVLLPKNSE